MNLLKKCSQVLQTHIRGIDLEALCRISESRLQAKAFPNIGLIESVDAVAFSTLYDSLYIHNFPHDAERERSDLITERLDKEFSGQRQTLQPYRIVGIRSHDGKAIGAAQFSTLLLRDGRHAVPYLQYIYVRAENRRQDMSEVLHTMVLAVAVADAKKHDDRVVPFTLFETDPSDRGKDADSRAVSKQRTVIHAKSGAVALMLRYRETGEFRSPHVQPGLEPGEGPLSLLWAIRESPVSALEKVNVAEIGPSLITAYYQSLRDEGFPEENIALAESMVEKLRYGCDFVSMSLADAAVALSKGRTKTQFGDSNAESVQEVSLSFPHGNTTG